MTFHQEGLDTGVDTDASECGMSSRIEKDARRLEDGASLGMEKGVEKREGEEGEVRENGSHRMQTFTQTEQMRCSFGP